MVQQRTEGPRTSAAGQPQRPRPSGGVVQRAVRRIEARLERRRLAAALLLSLLFHAWLLSLNFSGQGLRLPGFGFPWQDRRIEEPDLRVVVVAPQATAPEPAVELVAEPLQPPAVEQPAAGAPAPTTSVSRGPAATPSRIPCADAPHDYGNDRAQASHAEGSGQIEYRRRDPCGPCAKTFAPRSAEGCRAPAAARAGRDRAGADRRAHVGRAHPSTDARTRHRGRADRLDSGAGDATASRCRRCSAGASRPGGAGAGR